MRQQRGQQHPELGPIQPEASEDSAFACGKTSGEGLGQDSDPPASVQSGWAKSDLYWFFLFLWDSVEEDVFKEALFSCGCGSLGLWGAGGGGGRAGQRFLESNLLHRGYTLENPRRMSFEEPPGRRKGEAYDRARLTEGLDLLFPWLWRQDLRVGESGSALSLEAEGSPLLPSSGSGLCE